jgi:hypothetical protein
MSAGRKKKGDEGRESELERTLGAGWVGWSGKNDNVSNFEKMLAKEDSPYLTSEQRKARDQRKITIKKKREKSRLPNAV